MKFLNKEINYKIMLLISGIIGAIAFLLIYGPEVLDVTNDRWLISRAGDLSAHHIGWLYYRDAPWQFPIGLQEGITYPYKFSVVYMDSIPVFALFFKLISPFLPASFQYFGLYGLFTYILQAVLGCILVYNFTKDTKASVIGSVFFTMSSVVIQRMLGHSALAFHPIILLAMICYFNRDNVIKKKRDIVYWSLMLSLACSVQAYFVPMIFAFMTAFYLPELISKEWYKGCIKMAISALITVFVMYVWGYFYGAHKLSEGGLGAFNSNINALFNDQGNSLIASLMGKTASGGIWEAYAYLGVGIFILAAIALCDIVQKGRYKEFKKKHIPIVCLVVIFVLVSIVPVIRFGEYTILELKMPQVLERLFGTFRANGRFMWPVMYLVMTGAIVYVICNFKNKALYIMMACLMVQILDLSPACAAQRDRISILTKSEGKISSDIWKELKKKEVFFFYEPVGGPMDVTTALGKYANDHDMVMNDFYTSRKDNEEIAKDKMKERDEILKGNPDKDKLYVFSEMPVEFLSRTTGLYFYEIDGILIGITDKLPDWEEISIQKGIDILPYASLVTSNVKDDSGHHIYRGSAFSANNIKLAEGTYRIEVRGDNLDNAQMDVTANDRSKNMYIENVQKADEMVSFYISVDNEDDRIEFCCQNTGTGEMLITNLLISADGVFN